MKLLGQINGPEDLHELTDAELVELAQEVREHIIDTVGEIGGHFGANLGTCELAVALHSVLDSPRDKILWDVGHQAYPHKVLTGRRDQLATIRQYGGLAPFCSIAESPHDIMGAGHASTSIGYAVGIKEGMRQLDPDNDAKVVAVIGDGAMTGGVAFEAIGQAGGLGTPIVVVLNDNGMSIAPNVGALSRYFNRVRLNPKLWRARSERRGRSHAAPDRDRGRVRAPRTPPEGVDQGLLGARAVVGGARLGLHGRDRRPRRPRPARGAARGAGGRTPGRGPHRHRQGQGLRSRRGGRPGGHGEVARGQAQLDRQRIAGPPKAAANGASGRKRIVPPQYTQVFGEALVRECERDERVVGITAAMNSGTGLSILQKAMPGALLRRRHRRAAGGPVRRRARARGRQAGGGDLLDLPAARLRPDRPRRLPAAAERRLRDGPGGARGRRRAHPPRRLRHRLPALPAQHRADGPPRRGDARPHAAHRAGVRRRADRPALPARGGHRGAAAGRGQGDPDRLRRDPAGALRAAGSGPAGGADRLRHRRRQGARGGGAAERAPGRRDGRRRALREADRRRA